ncbi:hypothetical protein WH47_11052 [Habropoda laboriosa]|uniref:Uncharacterized protein n=1 Tax=Habropoda laboriosa TaxID=597456 RepID=A0A0L7QLD3_9HYME|nr:hypothetical protein WH47_11052 [Habropoda laboriosa]
MRLQLAPKAPYGKCGPAPICNRWFFDCVILLARHRKTFHKDQKKIAEKATTDAKLGVKKE